MSQSKPDLVLRGVCPLCGSLQPVYREEGGMRLERHGRIVETWGYERWSWCPSRSLDAAPIVRVWLGGVPDSGRREALRAALAQQEKP